VVRVGGLRSCRSFPRSAWECSPGRSASLPEPNAERPLRHSHAERGNDKVTEAPQPSTPDRRSCNRSRSIESGGSCTRVDRPGIKEPGIPEGIPRTATATRGFRKVSESGPGHWRALIESDGQIRSPTHQRPGNDRAGPQGAQAGGFWRMRRQWRKVAWLCGHNIQNNSTSALA